MNTKILAALSGAAALAVLGMLGVTDGATLPSRISADSGHETKFPTPTPPPPAEVSMAVTTTTTAAAQ
ncbi:hypothetical protein ACXDF8_00090 [Mycolicibacterium sp. CBM1]